MVFLSMSTAQNLMDNKLTASATRTANPMSQVTKTKVCIQQLDALFLRLLTKQSSSLQQ